MSRHPNLPMLLTTVGLGVGLGGLLLLLPSPKRKTNALPPHIAANIGLFRGAVDVVIRTESGGNYGAQNQNTDGAGLSYGLMQWTQSSGNLGKLLLRLFEADPEGFKRIFGGADPALLLLQTTNARSRASRLAPVAGAVLWGPPWTARFTAAGQHLPFQQAQWAELWASEHWQGAEEVVSILGVRSQRAYALAFDRSVHQGPKSAVKLAEQVRDRLTANGSVRMRSGAILQSYAASAAARFYATARPSRGIWRYVPGEDSYHRMSENGAFDLFRLVSHRTNRILTDPGLADEPISRIA